LLQKVVGAVINKGHASDLYDIPELLLYYGTQIPEGYEQVINTGTIDFKGEV
jgi:hypothetical protein